MRQERDLVSDSLNDLRSQSSLAQSEIETATKERTRLNDEIGRLEADHQTTLDRMSAAQSEIQSRLDEAHTEHERLVRESIANKATLDSLESSCQSASERLERTEAAVE
jgi:chromosome segregation ATPase